MTLSHFSDSNHPHAQLAHETILLK